jgi:glycosyltransferase involved in cell wall biosynthesis
MKIVVALASSSGQLSGVQRHAINLAGCLLTRADVAEVHLVTAPWQREFVQDAASRCDARLHLHTASIGKGTLSRNLWFYAQLPKLARQLQADIVHLAYPVPVRHGAYHCPTVVTLHDLYPFDIPENFGFPKVFFNRAVLRQCLRSVDAIACVSQSTLSRLKSMSLKSEEKSVVIYNSVEEQKEYLTEMAPPQGLSKPFLLCVAQHRRNKNIVLALRVFVRMLKAGQLAAETRMLVVGIPGPETAAIRAYIATAGLEQRVVLLNGIPEAELQWCYRNCSLLLAPSSVEGFGLPVAEGLLAGCSVVCSDIAAFRELGGDHCRYVQLGAGEEEAFADAIRAALIEEPQAPVPLPQLSPPVIADEYMHLYRSLISLPGARASTATSPFPTAAEREHLS